MEEKKKKVVIIGSGPAGYTAAIYAARANLKPMMFEGFFSGPAGGQLMTTTEVENYPGFPEGITGPELMENCRKQAIRFGAEILPEDVDSVDFSQYPFVVKGKKNSVQSETVIISTGAMAKRLEIPGAGEGQFWQKGVTACAVCDGAMPIFRNKPLFVNGASIQELTRLHMNLSFFRIFFLLIAMFFFGVFANGLFPNQDLALGAGILGGAIFAILLMGLDALFKQFHLRGLIIAAFGLFLGYVLSQAILLTFGLLLETTQITINPLLLSFLKTCMILFSAYFGMTLTARAAEEYSLSLPFINLKGTSSKRKDVLLDPSILSDPRLIDIMNSGLLDQQLLFPKYAIKELQHLADNGEDEAAKAKARKALDTLKKLEGFKDINLRTVEDDIPAIKDPHAKLTSLAKKLDANILTAEINKIQQSELEDSKIININFLSHALKPITTAGEQILIKIQRFGKEPRQGIGYLDDGTMVVVNGGAEFIGDTIKAIVLSVKSTTSGRMIFCNALEDPLSEKGSLFSSEAEAETASLEPFQQ